MMKLFAVWALGNIALAFGLYHLFNGHVLGLALFSPAAFFYWLALNAWAEKK